jgi:hypothetical protein
LVGTWIVSGFSYCGVIENMYGLFLVPDKSFKNPWTFLSDGMILVNANDVTEGGGSKGI